ncbi:PPE domain-containing protein [Prauserella flavalba]|uniref:PPE domain-containing protein n=1 Tax=Prauserella flavalba TaxID=1477506 RepID=UPI0036E52223
MQREPVHCLPYPWPRPEPEPEPGDLGQYVNWRTYSHRELYDMATTGLDLEGATEVAAQWSRLGGELDEIGQELRKALREAADGWQGASAEEARGKVEQLAGWTEESAAGSAVVSGCVSEQAALAATAKRNMPEPPPAVEVFLPTPQVPQEYWRTAPDLVADPAPEREESRQLHQQAAEVMEQYQRDSNELYGRVPAFQSPDPESLLLREPDSPPPPPREPGPKPEPAPDDGTTASSVSPVAPVAGGTSAPGSPGGGTVTPMTPGQQSGGEQPGAGPRAGAAAPSGQAAPPAAAATAGPRGGAVPGAMPMGAAAGARPGGDDDVERKSPSYLQEEDDLWGPQVPVVPPVLGEGPRGGW